MSPNLEKNFISMFVIAVFSFSTALGMIFLVCIIYHLLHCHFDLISIFPFVVIVNWPKITLH